MIKEYNVNVHFYLGGGKDTTIEISTTMEPGSISFTFTATTEDRLYLSNYGEQFALSGLQIQQLCPTLHSMSTTAYRYRYNGKEQLSRFSGRYDYGFRMYDAGVGRFLSVDPLTKKYPELTPYQFASNTPIQAIDLDGLEAFFVHGTWSNSQSAFSVETIKTIGDKLQISINAEFKWTGFNSDVARRLAAYQLADHIRANRAPGEPLVIIGHSHGGNIGIMTTNILANEIGNSVDQLITVNTPSREYGINNKISTSHFNIYSMHDKVQVNGGNDYSLPDNPFNPNSTKLGSTPLISGEFGKALRTFPNATNIEYPLEKPDLSSGNHNGLDYKNVRSWINKITKPQRRQ